MLSFKSNLHSEQNLSQRKKECPDCARELKKKRFSESFVNHSDMLVFQRLTCSKSALYLERN